jgi:hypothetical protein
MPAIMRKPDETALIPPDKTLLSFITDLAHSVWVAIALAG